MMKVVRKLRASKFTPFSMEKHLGLQDALWMTVLLISLRSSWVLFGLKEILMKLVNDY